MATSNDFPEVYLPEAPREVRRSYYRGRVVTHEVVRGEAILEGDIRLGRADALSPAPASSAIEISREGAGTLSSGVSSGFYLWPNGVIPYVIDGALPFPIRATDALDHWNAKMGGTVQFVPRTSQADYLLFIPTASPQTCSSPVGYWGIGAQTILVGDACASGNLIHELGHSVGLWHEQTRLDRDSHVIIHFENVLAGYEGNFAQNSANSLDLAGYDFGSIMHYPSWAFSGNGLPTIETVPPGVSIGQRVSLSDGDVLGTRILYGGAAAGTAGGTRYPGFFGGSWPCR